MREILQSGTWSPGRGVRHCFKRRSTRKRKPLWRGIK
jgi:hypothetical protein